MTFTCNQAKHFGTKPIKTGMNSKYWQDYKGYHDLMSVIQKEGGDAMNQAAGDLMLHAWEEKPTYFINYLKNSKHSPFKKPVQYLQEENVNLTLKIW